MRVLEATTFDEYWADPPFVWKRPSLHGSLKQGFGDNIYYHTRDGAWSQENSHHSMHDGSPNLENVEHDTRTDRVLISDHFVYWGGEGPQVPAEFRDWDGVDISLGRQGHRCNFPDGLVAEFVGWLEQTGVEGYVGQPTNWEVLYAARDASVERLWSRAVATRGNRWRMQQPVGGELLDLADRLGVSDEDAVVGL